MLHKRKKKNRLDENKNSFFLFSTEYALTTTRGAY